MKRNLKFFLGLSLLALILVLVGCGGRGSGSVSTVTPTPTVTPTSSPDSSPSPTPTTSPESSPNPLSSDYFGLEVGAKLFYTATMTPGNLTDAATYEVLSEYQPGVFRTCWDSGDPDGEFIKKDVDGSYYEIGYWETDNIEDWDWYDEPYPLIIKNPITVDFESDWWGKALRQEKVTVPAGTFTAWLFEDKDTYNEGGIIYIDTWQYWFVPYLGWVQSTCETTKEGSTQVIESITAVLQSYSFMASKSIFINQNIKPDQTLNPTLSLKLRKILRRK